ncbi:MAG: nitroreductase, partial [Terrimicrobiaceae bacterium]
MPLNDRPSALSELLQLRQTILPKRLMAPGPDAEQLARILDAAAHA